MKSTKSTNNKSSVKKAEVKEHSKKLRVAKKRYFVPQLSKTVEASSLKEAMQIAKKELEVN